MRSRSTLLGTATALVAGLAAGMLVLGGQAAAAPASQAAAPASQTVAVQPLVEFKTAQDAGWFYTLSPTEAQSAAQQYGFVWQRPVGKLNPQPGPGTVAMYRLRSTARSSYLVSVSPGEMDNLAKSGQFVNEGILGYVDVAAKPGMIRLMRFSKNGQWRVGPESEIGAQQRAGYLLDGPVGWAQPA